MVWFLNGLVCKVLNLVPRHQEIVARILGDDYARTITVLIGISEIMMAVWVLSKYKSRFNVITQIVIILIMNILEYSIALDLLLWGRMNIVFALFFVALVYYNEFILKEHS